MKTGMNRLHCHLAARQHCVYSVSWKTLGMQAFLPKVCVCACLCACVSVCVPVCVLFISALRVTCQDLEVVNIPQKGSCMSHSEGSLSSALSAVASARERTSLRQGPDRHKVLCPL